MLFLVAMEGEAGAVTSELRPSAVWLETSTIGEVGTDRCLALARAHGLGSADAPVLGTKAPAEQGSLVVLASGPASLEDWLRSVLQVVEQRTMWIGAEGAATRLKLATNSWLLAVVEGAAESLALAEATGLDPGVAQSERAV